MGLVRASLRRLAAASKDVVQGVGEGPPEAPVPPPNSPFAHFTSESLAHVGMGMGSHPGPAAAFLTSKCLHRSFMLTQGLEQGFEPSQQWSEKRGEEALRLFSFCGLTLCNAARTQCGLQWDNLLELHPDTSIHAPMRFPSSVVAPMMGTDSDLMGKKLQLYTDVLAKGEAEFAKIQSCSPEQVEEFWDRKRGEAFGALLSLITSDPSKMTDEEKMLAEAEYSWIGWASLVETTTGMMPSVEDFQAVETASRDAVTEFIRQREQVLQLFLGFIAEQPTPDSMAWQFLRNTWQKPSPACFDLKLVVPHGAEAPPPDKQYTRKLYFSEADVPVTEQEDLQNGLVMALKS